MASGESVPSRSAETVVRQLFAAIDGGDVDALVALFAPEAEQRLGNSPWTRGREAIRAGNVSLLARIAGLSHEVTGVWESRGTAFVRSEVRYHLLDGATLVIPAIAAFTQDRDGLITSYQVWSDTSPLAG